MDIRHYVASDLDQVVALWGRCGLLVPWNDPVADIRLALESGHGTVLVGVGDGARIVAAVMVGHDGHRGWLYYLAVDSDRRGKGLGRRMVQAAEAWAAERGIRKAELMIRGGNTAVRAFYERLGYRVEDRVVMTRWLDGTEPNG
ncbi:MAG: GNAT family acetyltransferase [Rhodospirillaceae bacterium]|jgi:ribosomal protein S18 acetylase RimI-like enzyme|nr:GNAT family acetyltransferase [Rhodospirillaceae bacterium]MBT6117469.1 GNAT family acetyltransferase [Rhodospirillaceae bacterium]